MVFGLLQKASITHGCKSRPEAENLDKLFLIYADIETESLRKLKILQIAAVTQDGDTFCSFINPGEPLPVSGTNIHGLYFEVKDKQLYWDGRVLPSTTEVDALNKFNKWLKAFNKSIILVFHNGILFDGPVLAKFYKKHGLAITDNVKYLVDPLSCCRDLFKDTKNHKLRTLAAYLSVEQTPVRDAFDDSLALKKICEYLVDREKTLLDFLIGGYFKTFEYFAVKLNLIDKDQLKPEMCGSGEKFRHRLFSI
jgi:DNA polymerase III epsilon subunit-like protein